MNYLLVDIKRLFLSCLQNFYSTESRWRWNADARTTKIFIADKFSFNPSVIEKSPSIVLSRGTVQFENVAIDQMLTHHLNTGTKERSDLGRGSLTFNCLAKSDVEAEGIADTLFYLLTGFKDEFKKRGIFSIKPVMVSEVQLVRSDSSPRLYNCSVQIGYELQYKINYSIDCYGGTITDNNTEAGIYRQFIDYAFTSDTSVEFYNAPASGLQLTMSYTDKTTLANDTQSLTGAVNGVNKNFMLAHEVYGYYPLLSGITYTISGIAQE